MSAFRTSGPTIAVACFFSFYTLDAHSEITASQFYEYCQVPPSARDEVLCHAYISGLTAGLMYGKAASDTGVKYCIPAGIDYTQSVLTIRKFIEAHPELLSTAIGKDIGSTASMALTTAYRCKK